MPTSTVTPPPDDIFREVDPAKKQATAKRATPRAIQTPPSRLAASPGNQGPLSNLKKYLILSGVILLALALGGGAYYWLTRTKTVAPDNETNTNQTENTNSTNSVINQNTNVNLNSGNGNNNSVPTNSTVVPLDTDHDGLSDEEELQKGTNPKLSDSDGDGLSDKQEVILYKSDPNKIDTDGDGNSDGDEVKNGYNPAGSGMLLDINKALNSGT